jgi:hypothetical protein
MVGLLKLPTELLLDLAELIDCQALAALCAFHPSFKDVFEPFLYKQGLAIYSESLIRSELDKNPAVWAMKKNLLSVLARFISYGLDPEPLLILAKNGPMVLRMKL